MAGGRPSKYSPEFVEQAQKLCELGATDREIGAFFKVRERTIQRWAAQYPEFCRALKIGKEAADDRVERSLYRRATGYSFDAVKIFQDKGVPVVVPYVEHVPPDTTAGIFWLKNRRPQNWRDVKAVDHSGAITHKHVHDRDSIAEELARIHARLAERSDGRGTEQNQGSVPGDPTTH